MFMTPLIIHQTDAELSKFFKRINDPDFDYSRLEPVAKSKYNHIIRMCKLILEKTNEYVFI